MCQSACKPGSVWGCPRDDHSSGMRVAAHLEQPTRMAGLERASVPDRGPHAAIPIWSCSGWGLPCRRRCRSRGALLPHLFTLAGRGPRCREPIGAAKRTSTAPAALAVGFLWHFPWGRPRRPLAVTLFHGARTFLHRRSSSGRPADWPRRYARCVGQGQVARGRAGRATRTSPAAISTRATTCRHVIGSPSSTAPAATANTGPRKVKADTSAAG